MSSPLHPRGVGSQPVGMGLGASASSGPPPCCRFLDAKGGEHYLSGMRVLTGAGTHRFMSFNGLTDAQVHEVISPPELNGLIEMEKKVCDLLTRCLIARNLDTGDCVDIEHPGRVLDNIALTEMHAAKIGTSNPHRASGADSSPSLADRLQANLQTAANLEADAREADNEAIDWRKQAAEVSEVVKKLQEEVGRLTARVEEKIETATRLEGQARDEDQEALRLRTLAAAAHKKGNVEMAKLLEDNAAISEEKAGKCRRDAENFRKEAAGLEGDRAPLTAYLKNRLQYLLQTAEARALESGIKAQECRQGAAAARKRAAILQSKAGVASAPSLSVPVDRLQVHLQTAAKLEKEALEAEKEASELGKEATAAYRLVATGAGKREDSGRAVGLKARALEAANRADECRHGAAAARKRAAILQSKAGVASAPLPASAESPPPTSSGPVDAATSGPVDAATRRAVRQAAIAKQKAERPVRRLPVRECGADGNCGPSSLADQLIQQWNKLDQRGQEAFIAKLPPSLHRSFPVGARISDTDYPMIRLQIAIGIRHVIAEEAGKAWSDPSLSPDQRSTLVNHFKSVLLFYCHEAGQEARAAEIKAIDITISPGNEPTHKRLLEGYKELIQRGVFSTESSIFWLGTGDMAFLSPYFEVDVLVKNTGSFYCAEGCYKPPKGAPTLIVQHVSGNHFQSLDLTRSSPEEIKHLLNN